MKTVSIYNFTEFIEHVRALFYSFETSLETSDRAHCPCLKITGEADCYLYDPSYKPSKQNLSLLMSLKHTSGKTFCFNPEQEFDLDVRLFENPLFIKEFKKFLRTNISSDTIRAERNSVYWAARTLSIIEKFLVQKIDFCFSSRYSNKQYTKHEIESYLEDTKCPRQVLEIS